MTRNLGYGFWGDEAGKRLQLPPCPYSIDKGLPVPVRPLPGFHLLHVQCGLRSCAGVPHNDSKIVYGSTITALINFLIVAAAVYFVVVLPMQRLTRPREEDADAETPAPSDEARLLTEIRDVLRAQR